MTIMAGGTGGHVFPGLAVAAALGRRGAEVRWLGGARGLEGRLVPAAGIPLRRLPVEGLRGRGPAGWLAAPWRVGRALAAALAALRRDRPAVVLGMGGYAAGPGGVAAWLLGIPLVIHEQNAVAGLTNRLLARLARRRLEAFPGTLPGGEHVGNPVREAIAALPPPRARLAGRGGPLRVLVLGGSQGAAALNRVVPEAAAQAGVALAIRHQAGAGKEAAARAAYAAAGVEAEVVPFLDDMAAAYGWADLVVARAGALTVAELAAAGVPSILVPYPHAVDDHQAANAAWLAAAGAAWVVREAELDAPRLAGLLAQAAGDREGLVRMAEAARGRAVTDAAARVAEACLAAAGGR